MRQDVAEEFVVERVRRANNRHPGWRLDVRMVPSNEYRVLSLTPRRLRTHAHLRDACFYQLGVRPHLNVSFSEFRDWIAATETEPRDDTLELRERLREFMADKTVWFGTTSMLARELDGSADLRVMTKLGKALNQHPALLREAGVEVLRKPSNITGRGGQVTWLTALHRIGHE